MKRFWFTLAILLSLIASAGAEQGLDFPGKAGTTTTIRFKFVDPHTNGLPIYGPGGNGNTYIWRAFPRQQEGYYTAFFWGNDDGVGTVVSTFLWKNGPNGDQDTYYGAHPYPDNGSSDINHKWEISVNAGDPVNGVVEYDRWFTQALRVWSDGSGKHHEFYWDLPNTDSAHMVTSLQQTTYGNTNPPFPALTWGGAPWEPHNEEWSGILRGIRVYSTLLSLSDTITESTAPLSTTAGAANVWYMNMNPTPSDISDKSSAGHNPAWVGSERPTLFDSGPVSSTVVSGGLKFSGTSKRGQ